MTVHPFRQVDVFTNGPFTGNPLAVVHDADDVSTDEMQTITRWTNLSEAAFLMQPTVPGADYLVRIFEPKTELPFAGHPTLGACAAWLDAGGVPREPGVVVQECGAGLVKIKRTAEGLAFAAPPTLRHEPIADDDLQRALDALGLARSDLVASHWIDNGPAGWGCCSPTPNECWPSARRSDDISTSTSAWPACTPTMPAATARSTWSAADIWVGGAVDVRISGSIDL